MEFIKRLKAQFVKNFKVINSEKISNVDNIDKDKVADYINFCKTEYTEKLNSLNKISDLDKCCMLSGGIVFMDMLLKKIEDGDFD